jgi:hypothetical protein
VAEWDLLRDADAAFQEKKYREAGGFYTALYRMKKLPADRHAVWAYCRRYEVVQRLNEGPQTRDEWDLIREEIRRIRKLSPNHWYDAYLANLVDEMSRGTRTTGSRPKGVVRGASPDEPAPAPLAEGVDGPGAMRR